MKKFLFTILFSLIGFLCWSQTQSNSFDCISKYKKGCSWVYQNGRQGLISENGVIIIPTDFDYISPFKNGFAWTYINGKQGLIDFNGKILISNDYDCIQTYNSKFFKAYKDSKEMLIEKPKKNSST